jgi:hypothetical protein
MKNTYKSKNKSNKNNFDTQISEIDEQNLKFFAAVESILSGGY